MKTLIHWAVRCYPASWRNRYGVEFDALLEDIAPSFGDACDVLAHALHLRAADAARAWLIPVALGPSLRLSVFVSVMAHAVILACVVLLSSVYVTPLAFQAAAAPLPPPAPDPPAQIADPRVFPQVSTLYSSLPLRVPVTGSPLPTSIDYGVGIRFPLLPDAGSIDRRQHAERRIWQGQALEGAIVRRVLPQYPIGTTDRRAVSVFVEYLIAVDGSVLVLRTSGPALLARSARSAIEGWLYRPVRCDDRPCEAVSRVELRFVGELAASRESGFQACSTSTDAMISHQS